eukprot:6186895-Pleurochrysis_carterae.AAC.1
MDREEKTRWRMGGGRQDRCALRTEGQEGRAVGVGSMRRQGCAEEGGSHSGGRRSGPALLSDDNTVVERARQTAHKL